MPSNSKRRVVFHIACAFALCMLATYSGSTPSASERDDIAPDAATVERLVERSYRHPARHSIALKKETDERDLSVVKWSREYDGIEMATTVSSMRTALGWRTEWRRELAEPEPVRRSALVSFVEAADRVGVGAAFARGEVAARLVYRPKLKLVAEGDSTSYVVENYQLVIELEDAMYTIFVDAYTGAVVGRFPNKHY
jgi:hypothetical protein